MSATQEKFLAQLTARYQKIADDATADLIRVDAAMPEPSSPDWAALQIIGMGLEGVVKGAESVAARAKEAI